MEDEQAHQPHDPEEAELVRETRLALLVRDRAQELAGSSRRVPGEIVTLKQAISVVEKHGGKHAWLDSADPVDTIEVPNVEGPKERPFAPLGS
jgi:hypothetical protein